MAPCSKLGFADWWAKTAAPRFAGVPGTVLDHRRFWDASSAFLVRLLSGLRSRKPTSQAFQQFSVRFLQLVEVRAHAKHPSGDLNVRMYAVPVRSDHGCDLGFCGAE